MQQKCDGSIVQLFDILFPALEKETIWCPDNSEIVQDGVAPSNLFEGAKSRMTKIRNTTHRKRCIRLDFPGHAHELTFSCYKSLPLLSQEVYCKILGVAIEMARGKHRFDLWAYVFMPEHVHLLIHPRDEIYSISHILQTIKQSTARKAIYYLRRNDPSGLHLLATGQKYSPYHFWQDGGGYDRNIIATETLILAVNYIHANPVRKGLAKSPDDWMWSSAREWSGGVGPVHIDLQNFPIK